MGVAFFGVKLHGKKIVPGNGCTALHAIVEGGRKVMRTGQAGRIPLLETDIREPPARGDRPGFFHGSFVGP